MYSIVQNAQKRKPAPRWPHSPAPNRLPQGRAARARPEAAAPISPREENFHGNDIPRHSARRRYGKGIYIGYAYKRIWEGGHGTTSQHYAGVSFDVGQNVSSTERVRIRDAAVATKAWGYVEPISMTPRWVHFDRRYGTAACSGVGYPTVRRNSRSTYVLILQDGLNYLIYFLLPTEKQRKQAVSKNFLRFDCFYGIPCLC